MDGCGKSTITELLAKKLSAVAYRTPPHELSSIRKNIDSCNDRYTKFFYYMSCNFYASYKIQEILKNGDSVVCDRYYYTTISAYYDVLKTLAINTELLITQLTNPDFAFFLDISEKERKKRLEVRENASIDDLESMNLSISSKSINAYKKMNLINIDTRNISENEVVDTIIKYIEDHRMR